MTIPEQPVKQENSRSSTILVAMGVILVVLAAVTFVLPRMASGESGTESVSSTSGSADMAPLFVIESLDDRGYVSMTEMKGKPVWLTFWATWCPPCKVEMPDLNEVIAEGGGDRFEYVAIATGEDFEKVQAFIEKAGYVMPVGVDNTSQVAIDYDVYTLPKHIFINADGEIVDTHSGILRRSQIEELTRELW